MIDTWCDPTVSSVPGLKAFGGGGGISVVVEVLEVEAVDNRCRS